MNATPRVIDNDRDEITVTLDGKEIRGWSYADEAERRVKMRAAREFVEGWLQATERGTAPEMAEALRRVVSWKDAVSMVAPELGGLLTAMYAAEAVLKKAGG